MRFAPGIVESIRMNARLGSADEAAAYWNAGAPEVPVSDLTYPGGAGQPQPARLYHGGDGLALLTIHGGGWVGGSIDLHDRSSRALALGAACTVFSISYRLAPDHPYPAALSDCRAALAWLRSQTSDPIALGGASAGGNLAAATALAEPEIAGLLLFYPVLGDDFETESYCRYGDTGHSAAPSMDLPPGLTRARMETLWQAYDPGGARRSDPLLAPLRADLSTLPPTAVIYAEHDVLADDSRQFAALLRSSGAPVTEHMEPGTTHGYINRGRLVPAADTSLSVAAQFLSTLKAA